MQIKVEVSGVREVQAALTRLSSAAQGRAMAQVLRRTAEKARTEIDRSVRAEYAISSDRVRGAIQINRVGSFEKGTLAAIINIYGTSNRRGRSSNVIRYLEKAVSLAESRRRRKAGTLVGKRGASGKQQPILRFRFRKGGSTKTIPGTFIGNDGRTVFRRVGKSRLPIEPVRVIDLPQMFTASKIKSRVLERISRELRVEADRAVRFATLRAGA